MNVQIDKGHTGSQRERIPVAIAKSDIQKQGRKYGNLHHRTMMSARNGTANNYFLFFDNVEIGAFAPLYPITLAHVLRHGTVNNYGKNVKISHLTSQKAPHWRRCQEISLLAGDHQFRTK